MSLRFIKISAVYFIIAITFGMYMSIAENFTLMPVHTHINLLGWVSLAIIGIIYRLFPDAENTKLAKAHFWLHNIGLPIMMASLAFYLTKGGSYVIGIKIGSTLVYVGVVLFVINVFTIKK